VPYDGDTRLFTETKPIDRLIEALRGPEPKWWDFSDCHTCAMHTAVWIGLATTECTYDVARGLWPGIEMGECDDRAGELQRIFTPEYEDGMSMSAIRPRHVASALEHYRDTGEALSPFEFVKREGR
jgi:hypothetical protein